MSIWKAKKEQNKKDLTFWSQRLSNLPNVRCICNVYFMKLIYMYVYVLKSSLGHLHVCCIVSIKCGTNDLRDLDKVKSERKTWLVCTIKSELIKLCILKLDIKENYVSTRYNVFCYEQREISITLFISRRTTFTKWKKQKTHNLVYNINDWIEIVAQ